MPWHNLVPMWFKVTMLLTIHDFVKYWVQTMAYLPSNVVGCVSFVFYVIQTYVQIEHHIITNHQTLWEFTSTLKSIFLQILTSSPFLPNILAYMWSVSRIFLQNTVLEFVPALFKSILDSEAWFYVHVCSCKWSHY